MVSKARWRDGGTEPGAVLKAKCQQAGVLGAATDKRPFPRYRDAKETFERDYLLKALKMCGGNVKKAAKIAGRDRSTFYDLLNKYQITADSFRDLF